MNTLILAHIWQIDDKQLMRDNLCDQCYKAIQIGQIGQEETEIILSIKTISNGTDITSMF